MPSLVRRIFLGLAALSLLGSSCRTATKPDESCTGSETLLHTPGTLTLGVDFTYPPFAFVDGHGNQMGLEVDIVSAIADQMKLKFVAVNRTSSALVPLVLAHRFDVAGSGFRDADSLRRQVCLTTPYMAADLGMLTRVDRKVQSLPGYRVGVLEGGRAASWLTEHMKDVKFEEFAAEEDVLDALKNGQIDVAVDEIALARFAQARTGGALHVSGTISTGESYVFAISSDDAALKAKVDAGIAALQANGKLDRIIRKWLGP